MSAPSLSEFILATLHEEKQRLDRFDDRPFGEYHETHLAHALGIALEKQGYLTILEEKSEAYGKDRCDLYAWSRAREFRIEVKRGWDGKGDDWNAKPAAQLRSWLVDVSKLARHKDGERYFVLLHFRQKALELDDEFTPGSDWNAFVPPLAGMVRTGERDFVLPRRISPHGAEWLLQQVVGELTGNALVADKRLNTDADDYVYRLYVARFGPSGSQPA
jgi:hypothetical protein